MQENRKEDGPWYTHGWVWFLIILPLCVVIASFFTLYIAIVNAPDITTDIETPSSQTTARSTYIFEIREQEDDE